MILPGNLIAPQHEWRYAFILTPKGVSEKASLKSRFLTRQMEDYDMLGAEIDAMRGQMKPGTDMMPRPRKYSPNEKSIH